MDTYITRSISLFNIFQDMSNSHKGYRYDEDQYLSNEIIKCMTSRDSLSIQVRDDGDNHFIRDFKLKSNDIDTDQLGITETEYVATILLLSSELQPIARDLAIFGDSMVSN